MKLYQYIRKGNIDIPRYIMEDEELIEDGYMKSDIIFSNNEKYTVDNSIYIYGIDGYFYLLFNPNRNSYLMEETTAVESRVIPETKNGLNIYDRIDSFKKVIHHADIDEKLMMNMLFNTDKDGNIWVKCSYRDKDVYKNGYICYKNNRNNYANTKILDFKYTTILTKGQVDQDKLDLIHSMEVSRLPAFNLTLFSTSNSSKKTSNTSTSKKKSSSKKSSKKPTKSTKKKTTTKKTTKKKSLATQIAENAPSIVQNDKGFPILVQNDDDGSFYYDYTLNYDKLNLKDFYQDENYNTKGIYTTYMKNATYYNRFKMAMPDDGFGRGFVHIFFTRPDLNFINNSTSKYVSRVANDPFMKYQISTKRKVIDNLYLQNGQSHHFNMLLSNKARGFSLIDDSLETIDYGKTYQSQSINIARSIYKSQSIGTFEIPYQDNRDLDILVLHKAWIQYISNVYHGKWDPKTKYIYGKTLDYACAVYVVITAEDFETILYWSKYYGVFPINVPYSALSWTSEQVLPKPEYSITYAYSWKEDFNPLGLTELNLNAFRNSVPKSTLYVPSYSKSLGHAGNMWVGAPFVETIKGTSTNPASKTNNSRSVMKLRFRPSSTAK